jgi:hypothetical protein
MRHQFNAGVVVCVATVALRILSAADAHADDPTTADCLSANEHSIQLRADHKLRDARAQLLICAAASCPADIRNACMQRVAKVNDAIPTVVFEVKDANDNELTAVTVTMDGQPLVARLEGTAISLDPGEHVFGFEAAEQPRVEKRLVIHEGEKDRRERVIVGAAAAPPASGVAPAPAPTMPPAPPPPVAPPPAPSPPPDQAQRAASPVSERHAADRDTDESSHSAPQDGAYPRIWLGVSASFDAYLIPSGQDVCALSASGSGPLGDNPGYGCVDPSTGASFPGTGPLGPGTNQQILKTSVGGGDDVDGGLAPGNLRVLASFDYAVSMNVLLGARAGYVAFTDPVSDHGQGVGPTFPAFHLEARLTYLIGHDALTEMVISPMLLIGAGVGEFDADESTQLLEASQKQALKENAWLTAGPLFALAGGGVRILLSPRIAATGALKLEAAFGTRFLPGIAPELGVQFGL